MEKKNERKKISDRNRAKERKKRKKERKKIADSNETQDKRK